MVSMKSSPSVPPTSSTFLSHLARRRPRPAVARPWAGWSVLGLVLALGCSDDGTSAGTPLATGGSGGGGLESSAGSGGAGVTGGATSSGGAVTGTGGVATGGLGSGGLATGGSATGGSSSGGAGSGGESFVLQRCSGAATLKEAGECNDVLIGAAISQSHLGEAAYTQAAKEHNYVTPENEMKWDTVQGQANQFNFGPGDAIVNFAQQNGMLVKGHTLVWHSQLPGWVNNLNGETAVRNAMIKHIETVMTHYKGKVFAWDVVNEAIDVDNKSTSMGNARFRDTVFYKNLGEGYIDEAFIAAHAIDPDAKLFYNDFGTDGMNDKSDKVYELVVGMLERGVPIDGVGLQTHIGTPNPSAMASEIATNIARLTALGLEVQISELDINGCDGHTDQVQATMYHDIVAACVADPLCTAVTMWGITDKYSWLNSFGEAGCNGQSARALLWNDNYQKKGSYDSVLQALLGN